MHPQGALEELRAYRGQSSVLLVGHEPDFSELIAHLLESLGQFGLLVNVRLVQFLYRRRRRFLHLPADLVQRVELAIFERANFPFAFSPGRGMTGVDLGQRLAQRRVQGIIGLSARANLGSRVTKVFAQLLYLRLDLRQPLFDRGLLLPCSLPAHMVRMRAIAHDHEECQGCHENGTHHERQPARHERNEGTDSQKQADARSPNHWRRARLACCDCHSGL